MIFLEDPKILFKAPDSFFDESQAGAKKLLEVAAPIDQPVDNFMAWQVSVPCGVGEVEFWLGFSQPQFPSADYGIFLDHFLGHTREYLEKNDISIFYSGTFKKTTVNPSVWAGLNGEARFCVRIYSWIAEGFSQRGECCERVHRVLEGCLILEK